MASVASTYARAFAMWFSSAPGCNPRDQRAAGGSPHIEPESAILRQVWESPAIPAEQKRELLDAIVEREGIDAPVRNLVAVLIDHRRLLFWSGSWSNSNRNSIAHGIRRSADFQRPRAWATPKNGRSKPQIEKVTGKKVRAQYGLDASFLGGAVVSVGSTIYDGSVKGQLERIKEAISSSSFSA